MRLQLAAVGRDQLLERRGVTGSVRGGVAVASPVARWAPPVLSVAAASAFVLAGASSALAGVFARTVVTPVRRHAESTPIRTGPTWKASASRLTCRCCTR